MTLKDSYFIFLDIPRYSYSISIWLVVDLPLWKMMEWVTVGMIPNKMESLIKFHGSSHHKPVVDI